MKILDQEVDSIVNNFDFSPFEGKTVLITGASGLIGSLCVKSLLKANKNISVIALSRNLQKLKELSLKDKNLHLYEHDVTKKLSITDPVDYVIHAAAPTDSKFFVEHPVEVLNTIVIGTKNVLDLAKRKEVSSLVFLSSLEVYGQPDHEDVSETDTGYINHLLVRSSYSEGKKAAETLCISYNNEYDVPVKIIRLSQTIGPGIDKNDSRVFAQFARAVAEKKNIILHTKGLTKRSYCYVTDAILGIFTVLLKGNAGEVYNIANPDTYISIYDMAKMLENENSKAIFKISNECHGYNPIVHINLDVIKIMNLGWKAQIDLAEMYKRLIIYLEE